MFDEDCRKFRCVFTTFVSAYSHSTRFLHVYVNIMFLQMSIHVLQHSTWFTHDMFTHIIYRHSTCFLHPYVNM